MATVNGTEEDDTLYGTSEADSIVGLGGNDTLVGFAGADNLDGGDGIDSAFYFDSTAGVGVNLATGEGVGGSAEGDTLVSIEHLWGSSYNDTLTGNDGDNNLYGLDGNDILKGGGGADGLDGGSGDDILKGGGGADVLQGGSGNDTADYSQSPPTIEGGEFGVSVSLHPDHFPGHGVGADAQYDTYSSIENVTGSAFHDYLTGNDDANVLRGLDGNDSLDGEGGNDTLDGGNGNDQLTGGMGDDLLRGGAGADQLNGAGGPVTIEGSDTADYSEKTEGVSVTLNSYLVVDVFVGGVVEDTMRNMENVIGGSGNDTFVGDYLANVLNGGAGNDRLNGGAGADTLVGGAGKDIFTVDNVGDQVIELAGEGTDQVRSSISLTLGANIENLTLAGTSAINGTGNSLANIINGNSAANVLNGAGGADTMHGGAGNDTLSGGVGYDLLNGGIGDDTMTGGAGNDTYIVNATGDTVTESAGGGTDTVRSSIGWTLGANVESLLLLGTGAINGTGNSLANVITGNSGTNRLSGGGDNDQLSGGAGNDTLIGGGGSDSLAGGSGADAFCFIAALGASNVDVITDFSVAADTIQLDNDIFTGAGAIGTLPAGAFRAGTAAQDAGDRIIYDSATGMIYYDPDGLGGAAQVLFAQVTAGLALTNADFQIVG